MKKSIFSLVIFSLCFSIQAFSQKTRVGISGGVTISNMNSRVNDMKQTGNSLTGFMATMLIESPISSHLAFQPHIAYVRKGMKVKPAVANPPADTSIQLRYVDLPMNLVYTAGKTWKFYIGGGPLVSFNLPSKRVVETGGTKSDSEINFGTEATDHYRGVDWGVNGLAGIRLKNGFFVSVNYSQGLRNLMVNRSGDSKINNNYAGIQIGYLFSNNSK